MFYNLTLPTIPTNLQFSNLNSKLTHAKVSIIQIYEWCDFTYPLQIYEWCAFTYPLQIYEWCDFTYPLQIYEWCDFTYPYIIVF